MPESTSNTPWIPVDRASGSSSESSNTSHYSGDPSSYALNRWFNESKQETPFNTIDKVKQSPSQSTATGAGGNPSSSAGATNASSHKAT
ncbi:hypothetical protein PspLS_10516 [Pyricularia sp. CBS 133598]|nr:hypothetical protein PspLS_10516 [Pyricularia sp. CBS 133598]